MFAKYGCIMFAAIVQKHVLGHNFLTKVCRMMILVTSTMFWAPRNKMALIILMVCLSVHLSIYMSVWLAVCPSCGQSRCLSLCLSIWLSVYPPVTVPPCPPVSPSVHSSYCLIINLTFAPSVHLSGFHRGLLLTVTGYCTCTCLLKWMLLIFMCLVIFSMYNKKLQGMYNYWNWWKLHCLRWWILAWLRILHR